MAATSTLSSSPSSETTGKPHPYQIYIVPGAPKGAYEARQVRAGLYIRVDMPGVPDDTVKVAKYVETRTVTFSGKAPPPPDWAGFDSNETRIYAGYVVVDRDLADVDFETHFKNGCLRMFFPCCDGSLHFLSRPSLSCQDISITPRDYSQEQDDEERVTDEPKICTLISHDPENPSGIRLTGGCPEHINPYLISGVKGVYEHKILTLDSGDRIIYVRLDIPDTSKISTAVIDNCRNSTTLFGGAASKKDYYSRFDEATRGYQGFLTLACQCCCYSVVKQDNASGVLRVLVNKTAGNNKNKPSTIHCTIPHSSLGGRVSPSMVELAGHLSMFPTLSLRSNGLSTRTRSTRNRSTSKPSCPAAELLLPTVNL